jgi:ATP-binding cassette, subfamily B, bacterial
MTFATLRRAMRYFLPDKWKILALLLIISVSSIFELLEAWPAAVLVDDVFSTQPHSSWMHNLFLRALPHTIVGQIIGLAVIFMLLKLLTHLCQWGHGIISYNVGQRGTSRGRCDLFRKLEDLGVEYNQKQSSGESIYLLNSDVEGCHSIFSVVIELGVSLLSLSIMLTIMVSCSPRMTLYALAVVPFLVIVNLIFSPQMEQRTEEAKEADTRLNNSLIHAMKTMPVVQAFSRVQDEFKRFENASTGSASSWQQVNSSECLYIFIIEALYAVAFLVIFAYGGYVAYQDQFVKHLPNGFTVGAILVFIAYLNDLWVPLCRVTSFKIDLQQGLVGARRLFAVLDRAPAVTESPDAKPLPVALRTLTLDDVHFGYDGKPVLKTFSANIPAGSMVAFVGQSGGGKSTLLNLLPRFYDPGKGTISLDGEDTRNFKLEDVRSHFACAFQDSVLLPTTVYENITFGRPTASREEVIEAAKIAGVHDFIELLPTGYDTVIDEKASNFSGGERQRIAIARALLSSAPILVLDEPTSALDPEHERQIVSALLAIRGKRTIILVTHRLASVVECDLIHVVRGGRIVEQGTHIELMNKPNSHYSRMLRIKKPAAPKANNTEELQ